METIKPKSEPLHLNLIPEGIQDILSGRFIKISLLALTAIALLGACTGTQSTTYEIPPAVQTQIATTPQNEPSTPETQITESSRKAEYENPINDAKKEVIALLPSSHPELISVINEAQVLVVSQTAFQQKCEINKTTGKIQPTYACTERKTNPIEAVIYLPEDLIDNKNVDMKETIEHELLHRIKGFSVLENQEPRTIKINQTTYTLRPNQISIETYARKFEKFFVNFSFNATPVEAPTKVEILSSQTAEIVASLLTSGSAENDKPYYFFDDSGNEIYSGTSFEAKNAAKGLVELNKRGDFLKAYIDNDVEQFLLILGNSIFEGEKITSVTDPNEIMERGHNFLISALNSIGEDYPVASDVLLHGVK